MPLTQLLYLQSSKVPDDQLALSHMSNLKQSILSILTTLPTNVCFSAHATYDAQLNNFTGIIHISRPIFGTQFHPEAKGGPLDSSYLFEAYLDSVRKYKESQKIFSPHRDSKPSPLLVDLLAKERVDVAPTQGMAAVAAQAQRAAMLQETGADGGKAAAAAA